MNSRQRRKQRRWEERFYKNFIKCVTIINADIEKAKNEFKATQKAKTNTL